MQPSIAVSFVLPSPKAEQPPVDVTPRAPQQPPDYSRPALPKPPERQQTPFGIVERPGPRDWMK